jgi:signal transduction histidine kinase
MKVSLTVFFTVFLVSIALSQRETLSDTARFKDELSKATQDSSRSVVMGELAEAYRSAFPDSALFYGQRSLSLARRAKFPKGEIRGLLGISVVQRDLGNHSIALDDALKAVEIAKTNNVLQEIPISLIRVGNVYLYSRNFREALKNYLLADEALKVTPDDFYQAVNWIFMSSSYTELNELDSALEFIHKAFPALSRYDNLSPLYFRTLGRIQAKSGNNQLALDNYRQGIKSALTKGDLRTGSTLFNSAAALYRKMGLVDSAIYYAKQGFHYGQDLAFKNQILDASTLLADLYEEKKDISQSLYYHKMASAAKDSMYSAQKMYAMQSVIMNEQERQRESEAAKIAYQNKVRQLALMAGLLVFLVIASILYRNTVYKQKANTLLKKQKQEIQDTLTELKATQAQLIQSEKMASLGELTAGIAHEIQNPLNFVNNFSDLNTELITEASLAMDVGNQSEVKKLLSSISQNEEKIKIHGRRAENIVRGMLQHSRESKGQKEPTDINLLADECLRLSYQGLFAKDINFNAALHTDFDQTIGKINIMPQEMGRVFLNLFSNAFYAVSEKKKLLPEGYEPAVSVASSSQNGSVIIKVRDNGNGIPEKVISKIFQPFFTTKPTGQGTGLGLSLSYDIVKAHGGEIKVTTKEGGGSEFIIQLPSS